MKHILILLLIPYLLTSQQDPPEQFYELAVSVDQEFIDKWGQNNYVGVIENLLDDVNEAYDDANIDVEFELIYDIQIFNIDYSTSVQYLTALTNSWEKICFGRDIIHHFTGRNLTGIQGTSPGSGLCSCSQGDYSPATGADNAYVSVSEHHTVASWVYLAHELGHNMGLAHENDWGYCGSDDGYFMCSYGTSLTPAQAKISQENISAFNGRFTNGLYGCGNNQDYDSSDPTYCNFSMTTMYDDAPVIFNCDNTEETREICFTINNNSAPRTYQTFSITYNKDNIEVLEHPDFGPPEPTGGPFYDTKQVLNSGLYNLDPFEIAVYFLKIKIKGFENNSTYGDHVAVNINVFSDPNDGLTTSTPAIFLAGTGGFVNVYDEPSELEITTVTTWNDEAIVNGDVYVKNNSSLNIFNDITFANNSRIIVERGSRLNIQGAELKGCNGEWGGILLEGSSGIEDLMVRNSTLSDAKTMITMDPRKLPFGTSSSGNAQIDLEDVTFRNCQRAIEFFSYDQVNNSSIISDCKFYDSNRAITMWNCRDISLNDNKFYDNFFACLISMNSTFSATNNLFESSYIGVLVDNPGPTTLSKIVDNTFQGASYGILTRGRLFGGLLVELNRFYNYISIYTDGDSNYDLISNLFQGDIGQVAFSNGTNSNNVNLNYFSSSGSGVLHVNDNSAYSFASNCFNSGAYDVYTFGALGQQGSPEAEAGNCFTHGGIGPDIDIESNGNDFTYYLYNDGENNCLDCLNPGPSSTSYSTNSNTLPNLAYTTCGPNIQSVYRYNYCNPHLDLDSLEIAIQYVEGQIVSIENDFSLSPGIKQALLSMYKRCLKRLYTRKFDLLIEDDEYILARNLYNSTVDFDEKINVYGSYIHEADYANARSYLNTISTTEEKELDFIWTQNVLIDYLEQRDGFSITQQQLDSINTILNKVHQYSSYARSLEYLINDSLVIPDIPNLNQSRINSESTMYETELELPDNHVSIYPNPFNNILNIRPNDIIDRIEIYNLNGQLLYKNENLSELVEIDTYDWNEGVYFIRVFEDNTIIEERNFINIRP